MLQTTVNMGPSALSEAQRAAVLAAAATLHRVGVQLGPMVSQNGVSAELMAQVYNALTQLNATFGVEVTSTPAVADVPTSAPAAAKRPTQARSAIKGGMAAVAVGVGLFLLITIAATLNNDRSAPAPTAGGATETRAMAFGDCISAIRKTAADLGVSGDDIMVTPTTRITKFKVPDGSVMVTCDAVNSTMGVSRHRY